ncbi:MAG: low molecular weight phosphotyrosine protein phosphatase [Saprospiraceae bacterium]|nr:low molecular weight phosphotyrosine protein phosphatase [Saprospiraceae bacterium]
MVCLGNICRSPLAEGILKNKVEKKGLDWHIDSAGTGNWHIGHLPDPRSIEIAKTKNIDITTQRARQIRTADFTDFDLILAMDTSNYQDLLRLAKTEQAQAKVKMIMNFVYPNQNINVPDPYWNDDGFTQVFDMLEQACEAVLRQFA